MRSPVLRHVVHLKLTLASHSATIWREVVVDRDLTLADLHRVVRVLLDGPRCAHHLFTDRIERSGGLRPRRRWGDKWTMIDFRDPTVIDEATARIGTTLAGAGTLVLAHTCDTGWAVTIEPGIDDIVAAAEPPARLVGGEGRAPLPCSRGEYEHTVLADALDDPEHPQHAVFLQHLSWLRGPWAPTETEAFDAASIQDRLDEMLGAGPLTAPGLPSFVAQLPVVAQPGARARIAAAGLDLPTVVTTDEMTEFVRVLGWIVGRAHTDGIPLSDGTPETSFATDAALVLGVGEDRIRSTAAIAKRLRLLYTRHGRLRAKKSAADVITSAPALWSALAEAVRQSGSLGTPPPAAELLLLAIADGSLADPRTGTRDVAHAYELLNARHAVATEYRWPREADDCGQRCECLASPAGTWHDLVTTTIQNAVLEARAAGVEHVISTVEADGLGLPWDWRHAGASVSDGYGPAHPAATRARQRAGDPAGRFLDDVRGLIEVLSVLGLDHADDGSWVVPPVLREFARAALQPDVSRRIQARTSTYNYVQYGAW